MTCLEKRHVSTFTPGGPAGYVGVTHAGAGSTSAPRASRDLVPMIAPRASFHPGRSSANRASSRVLRPSHAPVRSSSPSLGAHQPRGLPELPEGARGNSASRSSVGSLNVRPAASPWPLLDAMDDARVGSGFQETNDPTTTTSRSGFGEAEHPPEMHWTVSEPLREDAEACEAVAREAEIGIGLARELLDMGAVYVDSHPEGIGGRVKWRRVSSATSTVRAGEAHQSNHRGAYFFPRTPRDPPARRRTHASVTLRVDAARDRT